MARYSIASRSVTVSSGSAAAEFIASSTDRPRIIEIGIFMAAATASTFGIGRPQAVGVTPTSPITALAEEFADAVGTGKTATAWGTAPTVPLNFFRRIALPGAIGNGIIIPFPMGLTIPASGSLVIWNLALNGAADFYFLIDE